MRLLASDLSFHRSRLLLSLSAALPRSRRRSKVAQMPCLLGVSRLLDILNTGSQPAYSSSVYAKDLKAVKWHDPVATAASFEVPAAPASDHHPPPTHSDGKRESLKLRLIRRPQISTLALPRSSTWPSDAVPSLRAPWQFTPDAAAYAKFMLAPPDYMRSELESNLQELKQEVATLRRWGVAGGTDEELGIVFVQTAMRKVEEQIEKTDQFKTHTVMTARKKSLRELAEVQEKAGREGRDLDLPVVSETSSSEVEGEPETADEGPETAAPVEFLGARSLSGNAPVFTPGSAPATSALAKGRPHRKNVNPQVASDPDSSYYFYQAASGQNIFLHPLDIKILKAHFGTYAGMPDTIEVSVEGADEGTVTEDLRRRCRWLSHLPTSSDVVFIEADLSRVVSKSSLAPYAGPLKQRRQKRRDKARREDKAKAKSEQRENDSRPVYTQSAADRAQSAHWSAFHNADGSVPPSIAALTLSSSFDEPSHFPPPPSSNMSASPPEASAGTAADSRTVWGTRSFATTLRDSDRSAHHGDYHDDPDFDERWHEFEDRITGGGAAPGRGGGRQGGGGSASGSNSGSGRGQQAQDLPATPRQGGKKKKGQKLTLNLSGAAMRGSR